MGAVVRIHAKVPGLSTADELISVGRARLRRALIFVAPKEFQGSTESRPTLWFMGSLHSFCARIGTMNLRKVRAARQRAADVSSAEPSFFCRQDAGSTLRFMESFNLQD